MKSLFILMAFLLCQGLLVVADETEPVGAWTFDSAVETLVQDQSRYSAHGAVRGTTRRGAGPLGGAIWLDGESGLVVVPDRPHLRMTNAVTVDVWVKLPQPAPGREQCVVDKGGERYRIQIDANGAAHFGLKADNVRGDVTGGSLKPDMWHRITGVFQRPEMTLYMDGQRVAAGTWDHEIGPGESLFFGAKGGSTYFLKGWLGAVRIYNVPRPPQPGDEDQLKKVMAPMAEPKLAVQETDGVVVDTGAVQFALEAKGHGGLRWVKVGPKFLVRDNTMPPLFASAMASRQYDGWRDYAPDARFEEAAYRLLSFEHKQEGDAFQATGRAELIWPAGDRIGAEMLWSAHAGSPDVVCRVKLASEGPFAGRFLREVGVQAPLALNFRKRVVQGGDRGWQFDTRHFYQFHLGTLMNFLPEPEHNWWRIFMVEQDSPTHFRLWRAEDEDTAALTAQHGQQAPGWIAAYDQQGGVLWAYHRMAERAPKAVWADAAKSGVAKVFFHPPTARAIAVDSPQAKQALFSGEHRADWVWFGGEFLFAQPTRALAMEWGEKTLTSDPPAKAEVIEPALREAPPASGDRTPMVIGGLPLPKGAVDQPSQAVLLKQGAPVPLQTRALAYWPDHSIKWLLLVFPQDGSGGLACRKGTGEGKTLDFHVSLREGGEAPFQLVYGKHVAPCAVASPLKASREGDEVRIDTGPLALVLGKGETWLREVRHGGRVVVGAEAGQPLAFLDFLRTEAVYPVNSTHAAGALDPGALSVDSIELEESGPLRAVVRMEGYTKSKEPQRVILRLDAYAGRSAVRLFHSVEFLHKDPRRAFVRSMGLSLPVALESAGLRISVGAQDGAKVLSGNARTGVSQPNAFHYSVWQAQKGGRFVTEEEGGQRCRGWLDMADGKGGCAVVVRNMWQECPKEIVADGEARRLNVYLWPESAPLMDVRRYSNYPHPAQGESVTCDSSWVDKTYYPNDPFVGVSKTHELLLYFHDAGTPAEQIDAVAADFQSRGLVYVTPEWYASLGIALPYPAPDKRRFERADANLERVTDFWLFHQKLWAWYGMWDYGDVGHKFKGWGYGWILSPDKIARALKTPETERAKLAFPSDRINDYHTQQDWSFDNGRWGWGNTEGNPGLFLQMQYLRTGRRDIFFAVEAMARHTRDVDMRHDGKWFGLGTRHGVQHWSDGNHEERQTVHSEWRFHHYLTGEMRSRDFSGQLTERHYTKTKIWRHAAHSGRLYGLLTRWEMTGDPALEEMLKKYVHCFIVPEGIAISPPIEFPAVKLTGKPDEVNGESMFFHTFGAMHALLEYYELTRDPELKDAVIRMAGHALTQRNSMYTYRKAIIFAARYAADPAPYRKALDDWTRSDQNYHLFDMVSATPAHWTGETAFLRPGVSGQWFWLNDALYLMAGLDREPTPTEQQLKAFADLDARGLPEGLARESWQAEYDRPDLADYLRDRRRAQPKP